MQEVGHVQTYPYISGVPEIQGRYEGMRAAGEGHRLAEMLAMRAFPGFVSDKTFNAGRCNGNQFEGTPAQGDFYKGLAEAAGVSTTGKYYSAGLADFPGDPAAWVSGRGDVLRVAREKGFRVTGQVDYDPGEREPMPDVAIDPEIVEGQVRAYMAKDPGERVDDVRERITGMLTGAVDCNPTEE